MNNVKQTNYKTTWNLTKTAIYINHLTAWLAIPLLIAATSVYFVPTAPDWTRSFNFIFQILFAIHTIISIYHFRLPKLRLSKKCIQIYSGYGILITVVLNMVFYGQEPLATLVFWANWVFIAIHVFTSMQLWFKRRKKQLFRR